MDDFAKVNAPKGDEKEGDEKGRDGVSGEDAPKGDEKEGDEKDRDGDSGGEFAQVD
jgi:hypothetical protein